MFVLFDCAAPSDVKWPIFVTNTPTQRRRWAARLTDPEAGTSADTARSNKAQPCGNVSLSGGKAADVELITQIIRHEDLACVWGYIIGSSATAEEFLPLRSQAQIGRRSGQCPP